MYHPLNPSNLTLKPFSDASLVNNEDPSLQLGNITNLPIVLDCEMSYPIQAISVKE